MYTRFGDNDIVNRQAQELVTSTWTNNTNNLQAQHTASTVSFTHATSSGNFYIEIQNEDASGSTGETQFFVSYGHRHGSGSPNFTDDTGSFGLGASRVIYNQYRQLRFNDDTKFFTFGSHTPNDIYVININRARYKQRLTLGSLNLHISGTTTGLPGGAGSGIGQAQSIVHLTDDSVTNPAGAGTSNLGTYYNVVSGSSGVVSGSSLATAQVGVLGASGSYGHFFPEAGLIILNGDAFSSSLSPTRGQANSDNTDQNHYQLAKHMAQTAGAAFGNGGSFIIDTTEEINSEFYFCRAMNNQFNYTNNESFVDASKNIRFDTMQLNPKVFITTIGLYNDAFELVAIAI